MKKKTAKVPRAAPGRFPRGVWITASVLALGGALAAGFFLRNRPGATAPAAHYTARPTGEVTFNKHIAPILFEHCAACHRPGQSAPFAVLSYEDARKRTKDIAAVTGRRFMPPWLPEHGYGNFTGERRLSVEEMGLIAQWAAEGAKEGGAADLPPLPQW